MICNSKLEQQIKDSLEHSALSCEHKAKLQKLINKVDSSIISIDEQDMDKYFEVLD